MKNYKIHKVIHSNKLYKNKVFWLSIILLAIIASTFWTQSRVPALNEKAQVGDRINISSIAFDVLLPVKETQPLYERTYKAAVNWGYTNWKGMTFGFLLAAAFITLLRVLPETLGGKNKYLNSLYGLGLGSPMGVCVNCATPIAQGMISSGTKLETSLAMLISSPTLNPIVITIAFSLLSFHMALIKIIFSIIFIIILVPIIIKISGANKKPYLNTSEIDQQIEHESLKENKLLTVPKTWIGACVFTVKSFFKNLLYIIKVTLPLMLVAGLAGSLLIESLPVGSLSSLEVEPLTLLAVSAIGVFLPVPIAFDVLIVNVLINSGLHIGLAATLLFSLGIFSVYPALIIGRSVSVKLSLLMAVSVMLVSIMAGLITTYADKEISLIAKQSIDAEFRSHDINMAFENIVQTCNPLKKYKGEAQCLRKMFLNDRFLRDGINICESKSVNKDLKLAQQMCQQVYMFLKTKKISVEKENINECKVLTPEALVDECMINYIRKQSLTYQSLDACLQIKNIARQRYCRYTVISDRMKMKKPQACELGLSENMRQQCLDNLSAHITSEFAEINKCNELVSPNAQYICRSTVASLKITNLQDYSICKMLSSAKEITACEDKVVMHKAEKENKPSLCRKLSNKKLTLTCRINAEIRKNKVKLENEKLSEFKRMPHSFLEKDYSITTEKDKQSNVTKAMKWVDFLNNDEVLIEYVKNEKRKIQSGKIFKKVSGSQLGLNKVWNFDLTDFKEPFVYGKGIASGDINNDGWPDLVFASNNGVHVFKNTGEGKFIYDQHIKLADTMLNTFVVTFVDIDNDGWQDLFMTAYGKDNYIFKNNKGEFPKTPLLKLSNENVVALAAGFSDWDRDGDIDIALGYWSYGAEGAFIPEKSQNVWYKNNALDFEMLYPKEPLGETLSILMSDINNDKFVDLIVGNDRKYPDVFYLGNKNYKFNKVTTAMKLVASTSLNTMSYDSADFNNDLQLDIFSTDMSVAAGKNRIYCNALLDKEDKEKCEWLLQGNIAVGALDVGWCASFENMQRAQCYTAMAIKLAKRDRNKKMCDKVMPFFSAKKSFCQNISRKINDVALLNSSDDLAQHESNKLLINSGNNKFIDETKKMGVINSFWGWTGKAADLDNDGWQDIYIGNGLGFGQQSKNIHSNVFYHNQKGQRFKQSEMIFGLENYINTPNFTYLDFDLDGDLDIVSSGIMSAPFVYINQGTKNNSVSFVLRDELGNKFCIGCKIIINYNNGKKQQIRELKLSGGFMSYDEPVAYFGVENDKNINGIKIIWSTGEEWKLDKLFPVNRRYKISRLKTTLQ